jgi:hypothetical protein
VPSQTKVTAVDVIHPEFPGPGLFQSLTILTPKEHNNKKIHFITYGMVRNKHV